MHHNNENRCADYKLISPFSCPVFTTVFHCLAPAFQQRFCSMVPCLLYEIGFPSVITLMKANFTILKIFYKGTKRRVYNILYISLKLAYSVNIHLLIKRDYSLVQAQLASQENQQGSLHSPLLETITKSKLTHKLTKPL